MNNASHQPEGRIELKLRCRDGAVREVALNSTRPRAAEQLFTGRPVSRVLGQVPLLFSVCATAQGCAAVAATESALGFEAAPAHRAARDLLVLFETAREHLWRILLDWPGVVGRTPEAEALAASTRLFKDLSAALYPHHSPFLPGGGTLRVDHEGLRQRIAALAALLEREVFQLPLAEWLTLDDGDALRRWSESHDGAPAALLREIDRRGWSALGHCGVTPLPPLPVAALHQRLAEEADFTALPLWEGRPRETGALARQGQRPLVAHLLGRHGNGLLPRLVARLAELAAIPSQAAERLAGLNDRSDPPLDTAAGSGTGLAQVEAARGLLVHRVELEAGTVRRYQLLAPTEWNFHPRGVLAKGLAGLPAGAELERQTRLLIQAVDPCVGWHLEVEEDA